MRILVTGGLGYIGSHVTVALIKEGYDVMVVDNMVNSTSETKNSIERLCAKELKYLWRDASTCGVRNFDVVFHFAALKSVQESMEQPMRYYRNNINSLLGVTNIPNIIFSSSCAAENPISPYGHSKAMCEQIVKDCFKNSTILRYHNPVGNTPTLPSSNIGLLANLDNCNGEIEVFGNDYPTKDGTCERDFINIHDIVDAHLLALEHIGGHQLYTLGRGIPVSVKEFIQEYNTAKGKSIKIKYAPRRDGDIVTTHSTCDNAEKILGFKAKRNLFN
jgi:UDP-glucose 4-epimerase